MDIKFSVLIYSKYSPNSTKLIKLINELSTIFVDIFNIKLTCIDNENIRKQILSSKNIKITYVPSILIIYTDGGIEKYEGNDAFDWVESIILKYSPQKEENLEKQNIYNEETIYNEENILEEQPIKQSVKNSNKQFSKQPVKKIVKQSLEQELEDLEELDEKSAYKKKSNNSKNTNYTSIDDIDTEDEDEEEDLQHEILINNNHVDKSASTIKKNSLISLATEMQKSREDFVSKTDKNKLLK